MDFTGQFDKLLQKNDSEATFKWVMERLIWNPDCNELRGMAAFTFLIMDKPWLAREMAEEVLSLDPNEGWALATSFGSCLFKHPSQNYKFYENDVFKLGPEWIPRFANALKDKTAENLMYCLALYGSPAQKCLLSENYLATTHPDLPMGQLSLPIEIKSKSPKKEK
jgi:hypothetical protein